MAKPVEFPAQNIVFGKGQKEYLPLPAFKNDGPQGEVVTCWELSKDEIDQIVKTGRVYLMQMSFHQKLQPIWVGTECPLTDEVNAPYN